MLPLPAFGQCARLRLSREILRASHTQASIYVSPQSITRTWIRPRLLQSIVRTNSTARSPPKNSPYLYPERLNVFDSGLTTNLFIGTLRVATLVILGAGLFLSVRFSFSPEVPWYWSPLVALGGTLPMLSTLLLWAPYAHHIFIFLPKSARLSKEALKQWAKNVPATTKVHIQAMRLGPWPRTRAATLAELRRLPLSRTRLANLEHVPKRSEKEIQEHANWAAVARRISGRYFVNRAQYKDKSLAPGVWNQIWEQIPMVGKEWPASAFADRLPAVVRPPRVGPRHESAPKFSMESKAATKRRKR